MHAGAILVNRQRRVQNGTGAAARHSVTDFFLCIMKLYVCKLVFNDLHTLGLIINIWPMKREKHECMSVQLVDKVT